MASTSIYLNFSRNTEEAFNFYRSVFQTEFSCPISRMGDAPAAPGQPPLSDADKQLVMYVALPLMGGVELMGTDAPETMGFKLNPGNNVYINLQPDTRAEADRLFNALSESGKIDMPLSDMFWGAYFGSVIDKFGVQWMVNCESKT